MSRTIENEHPHFPEYATGSYIPPVNAGQNESDNKDIPHGVSPETYKFLLIAMRHNAFDNIDRITRQLIEIYYFQPVSLNDLVKIVHGISRPTAKKRILAGLNQARDELPDEIKSQCPKEKVIKLKDISPILSKKKRDEALWEKEGYREKTIAGLRRRINNPDYIARTRKVNQQKWNKTHGIEPTDDPLAKRTALLNEYIRLSQLLGHLPSSADIENLKAKGMTRFSRVMYSQEFGEGSFTRARKDLHSILMTLVEPSFEAAQKLTDYLKSKSKELATYGISEEDIQKHNAQIKEARDKILSATSEEETSQGVERLRLLLSRIQRKISVMTPLSIKKGRLRLQGDIL